MRTGCRKISPTYNPHKHYFGELNVQSGNNNKNPHFITKKYCQIITSRHNRND